MLVGGSPARMEPHTWGQRGHVTLRNAGSEKMKVFLRSLDQEFQLLLLLSAALGVRPERLYFIPGFGEGHCPGPVWGDRGGERLHVGLS